MPQPDQECWLPAAYTRLVTAAVLDKSTDSSVHQLSTVSGVLDSLLLVPAVGNGTSVCQYYQEVAAVGGLPLGAHYVARADRKPHTDSPIKLSLYPRATCTTLAAWPNSNIFFVQTVQLVVYSVVVQPVQQASCQLKHLLTHKSSRDN
jgi:hypothetical protein